MIVLLKGYIHCAAKLLLFVQLCKKKGLILKHLHLFSLFFYSFLDSFDFF